MKKGFVLMETIVVIVVISVALLTIFSSYNKILSKVKEKWESLALKYGISSMRPAFYETFNSCKNM